jgi:hypothetical protein
VKLFVLVFVLLNKFSLTTQVFKIRNVPLRNFAISLIRKFELTASILGSLKCVFGRQWTIRNDATVQRVEEAVRRTLRNKCRLINSLRNIFFFFFSSTTPYEFWLAQLFLSIPSSLAPSVSSSSFPSFLRSFLTSSSHLSLGLKKHHKF